MLVIHKLEIVAICPVDQKPDVYACTVEAHRVISVEDILAESKKLKELEMFQEDICQELHRSLACKVTLVGHHSGVRTEVICGGDE